MPLPYTEEALDHVASRVQQVQERIGRQFLLENPSSYVAFKDSTMTGWEFATSTGSRLPPLEEVVAESRRAAAIEAEELGPAVRRLAS